ncbi:hypothetical protein M436DRAFT_63771 [Aureobasidium namibiae CBS 147.97]|uniref:Uncharacterized protein n=1 Tax=Aureobasidium namibiae CBS 147.97 TaxID=1043004 RepID=A0A074WK21_9PEZI|nr:uncharacterized protein M436DRAFT_63771 [Aureobasidium namibiae CBS 147.97]KEQ73485.1 hypothetical protein M436DRAFT_63771 [Aureobasidium namibiae CBS 147.97]
MAGYLAWPRLLALFCILRLACQETAWTLNNEAVFCYQKPSTASGCQPSDTNMGPPRELASILRTLLFDICTFAAALRMSVRKQEMGLDEGKRETDRCAAALGIITETHSPEAHATSAACVRTALPAALPLLA